MLLATPCLASLLLALPLLPPAAPGDEKPGATAQAMAAKRSYVAGRVSLDLGGQSQTLLGFEGTTLRLDVPQSRDATAKARSTATLRCEEFAIELPATPEPAVAQWLADTLAGNPKVQDAAIVESDFSQKAVFVHRLREVQLRSLELGLLDANSKEAAKWTATLAASSVKWEKGDGKAPASAIGGKAKQASAASFRLQIAGLTCDRVARVGPLHVDFEAPSLDGRQTGRAPQGPRIAPLALRIADADPKEWLAWLDDAVTKGPAAARSGSLELLDASGKESLARIALDGLMPTRLSRENGDAGAQLVVELSCNAIKVDSPKQ
jgi:hypothetical protein